MTKVHSYITLSIVLLVFASVTQAESPDEPYNFFREFAGLNEEQITAIRSGKAVAKIVESGTPAEVFVFGAVYVEATPESYLELASDIGALRKLPSYRAIQSFSDPLPFVMNLHVAGCSVSQPTTYFRGHCYRFWEKPFS